MNSKTRHKKGSALIYILIAIALLAALTATFMDSSSQQTSSQNSFNAVTELSTQINFIRSAIQECVLTYPAGDSALVGTTNVPYPINPWSGYLANPSGPYVENIGCPGNPGDSNDHVRIFGGASGKFLPPPPKLFEPWRYFNGPEGVFIATGTYYTDSYLRTALQKLDDQFSECEADVIDATDGTDIVVASDGSVCPGGALCFRVWLIANPDLATYPGDADGDEADCPE